MGQLISLLTGEPQQKQEDTKTPGKPVPATPTNKNKPVEITDEVIAFELLKQNTQPPDTQLPDTQQQEQQSVKKYLKYKAKYLAMKNNNN